jgi:hypothetical protein
LGRRFPEVNLVSVTLILDIFSSTQPSLQERKKLLQ